MMLDNLYMIKGKHNTATGFDVDVSFNEKHPIYNAHFPGNPITPGVCIIEILKQLLESHYDLKLFMKTMRNVKFLQVIIPDSTTIISFKITSKKNEDGTISANVIAENANTCFTKMSAIYTIL